MTVRSVHGHEKSDMKTWRGIENHCDPLHCSSGIVLLKGVYIEPIGKRICSTKILPRSLSTVSGQETNGMVLPDINVTVDPTGDCCTPAFMSSTIAGVKRMSVSG